MFDFEDTPDLDEAFESVLANASFAEYSRESLASCETFCEMLRQAQHNDIVTLNKELAEIALETDDHNEASGFLMTIVNLGGGLETFESPNEATIDIPLDSADEFVDWVVSIPANEREATYQRVLDAQMKRGLRLKDDDLATQLTLHQIGIIRDYALNSVKMIKEFANFATEHLDNKFPIEQQIPDRLWEAFSSRGEKETTKIVEKWRGSKANTPQDFFIALEWQRLGYITIHQGKHYAETVAEYILASCEPIDSEAERHALAQQAERAIERYPHLKHEFIEALGKKEAYRWIVSHDMVSRTRYIKQLVDADILESHQLLDALDTGISKRWNSSFLKECIALRNEVAEWN
ncbi:hypothetical protein NBRC116494_12650 [Aurantivibrio plasticivorans]